MASSSSASSAPVRLPPGRSASVWPSLSIELDRASTTPLFAQLARGIAGAVESGRLRPGDELPGARRLAAELGVHRNTVAAAFEDLQAGGWIEKHPSRRTRVAQEPPRARPVPPGGAASGAGRARLGFPLAPDPEPAWISSGEAFPLSDVIAELEWFPVEALARAHRRALRERGRRALSTGPAEGHPRLRAALAEMLRSARAMPVDADNLLVTRGSLMGIDLLVATICAPGDRVAVENPGYPPAWEAMRCRGAELVAIDVDAEGLVVEQLAARSEERPIALVYVTPHHQYPTGVSMSARRRRALLDLARQRRFAVIEDDYSHEFHYEGRPLLPLASADDQGVVVYVGTLSKVLAPGLRVGYVCGPVELVRRAAGVRRRLDLHGDLTSECAVAELIEEGELARHARRMLRVYRARRDALVTAVGRHLPGVLDARPPPGGLALWASVLGSIDLDGWAERARQRGLGFRPGRGYDLGGAPLRKLRLTFATPGPEQLDARIEALAACL